MKKKEKINVRIVRGGKKKKKSKLYNVTTEDDIHPEQMVSPGPFCRQIRVLRSRSVGDGVARVGPDPNAAVEDTTVVITNGILVERERR